MFARDGRTVVGHWYTGTGFVGLDEDPDEIVTNEPMVIPEILDRD